MIKMNELVEKVYINKVCVQFTYNVKDDDGNVIIRTVFKRRLDNDLDALANILDWQVMVIFDRTENADTQFYYYYFTMPKVGMKLEQVAGFGLFVFQYGLKNEIQSKMIIDFAIGEAING